MKRIAATGSAAAVIAAGALVVAAAPASAAVVLPVTSTADVATNFGACGNAAQTVPTGGSLREAICAANNFGASAPTINVGAGTYHITNGELQMGKVAGSSITLTGAAGAASTIIDAGGLNRVFNLDPNLVGNVTTHISGVTITGGSDSIFGGGGIIAGSTAQPTGAPLDVLTVANSTITANHASGGSNTGGGIAFSGGNLTITNSTISNNTSNGAAASGVWYRAEGTGPGEGLTISGTTFSGNSVSTSSVKVGGALEPEVTRGSPAIFNISNSQFIGNTVTGTASGTPVGGAIWAPSGILNVTESTFTSNSVAGGTSPAGGAIAATGATVNLHYNRFTGNTGASGQALMQSSGSVDATNNWWGCNNGPGTAGCDSVAGSATVSPRLVLSATASPATVVGPNATSTITAALTQNSLGSAISSADLDAFAGVPVGWSDPLPSGATVGSTSSNVSSGSASTSYNSQNTSGPGHVLATLDNGTATAAVTVNRAPAITSANAVSFTVGTAASFTVTTTGYPTAAISKTGTVPPGMTFTDNGNGTATLSGTPSSGGSYPLSLTAANGANPNATQTLTVSVRQPPAFTSGATATFVIGSAGTFGVSTSGFPAVSTISEAGALPAGLTWTDNGNGTASLAGTPTGTGGTYPVTLTASNGVSPDASQNLTIQVNQAPAVTLNPVDQTVTPGTSVSFTAGASGVPTPGVQWQRSTDGGATFSNIAGAVSTTYTFTTAAGDDGTQYQAVFSNGVGSAATTTAATLHVGVAPAFTSADTTRFVLGSSGSFDLATSGVPDATLSESGAQFPAWLTLTDNGDGTGSLTGTPPAGSAGTYQFTLAASNGFSPDAEQIFTLFVDDSPVITSADHTTFVISHPGSFAVTTTAGFPTATAINETGTLPSGVTLVDHGDGTASLAGTPTSGTAGSYPITITAAASDGAAAPATQSFTLTVQPLSKPAITSISPASGPDSGGTTITIRGSGFGPSATVLIGQGPHATAVTAAIQTRTLTKITAVTPAGAYGTWHVFVRTNAGLSPATSADLYRYVQPRPTITSISPATGPATGGTTITIDGTGYTADTSVFIGQGAGPSNGAVIATLLTHTSTELTATTPPGAPGTWNVFVHTPGVGTSTRTAADQFTYTSTTIRPN